MERYRTVSGEGTAEQVIQKSRFLTAVTPASSRDEAEAFIASRRKMFRDATHNVPAFVLGEHQDIQWGSDDGEPQGTSGAPIVQLLVNEGLTNVCLVVTRWFGGIKLGTGGLVRAYTSSAKLGLEAAGICSVRDMGYIRYRTDYASFHRVSGARLAEGAAIDDVVYAGDVSFRLNADPGMLDACAEILAGATAGKLEETERGSYLRQVPITGEKV